MNAAFRESTPDALFIHTQTLSLFSSRFMRQVPTVISLDATPRNYDTVGEAYGHQAGSDRMERLKFGWHCRLFRRAAALTTWCQWAKDSLVHDYGVPPERVTVIPPGVDMALWAFGKGQKAQAAETDRPLRLLFVGGDFERKGGKFLIEAYRRRLSRNCTLDIVTRDAIAEREAAGLEGVRIHRGLTANSEPLRALYAGADLFVFPTLADCLPIAVMEAMAAGLPVVTTDVGALREEAAPGVNGLVVPPKDADAIAEAVCSLAHEPERLAAMGRKSRELAEARFDARTNYNAILDLMRGLAAK
jgi:glycosyltransferase involved in cell wall biosynthesis